VEAKTAGMKLIVRCRTCEVTDPAQISRVSGTGASGTREHGRTRLQACQSIDRKERMPTTDRLRRLLPLSGVLFAAVLATGLVLTAGEPDNSGSKADIYAYWHSHYGMQLISSLILIPFGMLFLLAFAAELRRALRSGEAGEALYSPIALAGGITAAVGLGVTGSLCAAVATAAHHHEVDATYTLAQLQSYDWVPWMAGFGVLLLASGIGGLRTRALPRLIAIAGLVLGVACLTPVGFFALFALPVWILVTSVALYRSQSPSRLHVPRAAPQAG